MWENISLSYTYWPQWMHWCEIWKRFWEKIKSPYQPNVMPNKKTDFIKIVRWQRCTNESYLLLFFGLIEFLKIFQLSKWKIIGDSSWVDDKHIWHGIGFKKYLVKRPKMIKILWHFWLTPWLNTDEDWAFKWDVENYPKILGTNSMQAVYPY